MFFMNLLSYFTIIPYLYPLYCLQYFLLYLGFMLFNLLHVIGTNLNFEYKFGKLRLNITNFYIIVLLLLKYSINLLLY
jgi:hypothetical protein